MEKKPLTMVAKDARDAAKKLNEYVEKGAFNFDFGISEEYVVTVSKGSDGLRKEEKEKRFRFTGFMDMYVGDELNSLREVREDLEIVKKEREEMNRTLNVMNKSPFAPISIFLLCVAIVTLTLAILTVAKILPIPNGQLGVAIALIVVGALALSGSILLAVSRNKKKKALLENKEEIMKKDAELQDREQKVDARVPQWYKNALWTSEGNVLRNASHHYEIK